MKGHLMLKPASPGMRVRIDVGEASCQGNTAVMILLECADRQHGRAAFSVVARGGGVAGSEAFLPAEPGGHCHTPAALDLHYFEPQTCNWTALKACYSAKMSTAGDATSQHVKSGEGQKYWNCDNEE